MAVGYNVKVARLSHAAIWRRTLSLQVCYPVGPMEDEMILVVFAAVAIT